MVPTEEGEPDQVLFLTAQGEIRPEDLESHLTVYLLPRDKPATSLAGAVDYRWRAPGEVDERVLQLAERVRLDRLPTARPYASEVGFRFRVARPGQLFLEIRQGLPAFGGYELGGSVQSVVDVALPPNEVEILGRGGVMALSGDRKISVKSRGFRELELEVGRVPPDRIEIISVGA